MIDYMAGKRQAKSLWLQMELFQARLRGETVHVVMPGGVFICKPDGSVTKADNSRGKRKHANPITRLD